MDADGSHVNIFQDKTAQAGSHGELEPGGPRGLLGAYATGDERSDALGGGGIWPAFIPGGPQRSIMDLILIP